MIFKKKLFLIIKSEDSDIVGYEPLEQELEADEWDESKGEWSSPNQSFLDAKKISSLLPPKKYHSKVNHVE